MQSGFSCELLVMPFRLKDDDLAGRIGLQAKELNKMMALLLNDRLVRVYVHASAYISVY
jgi:transcription initiation factor IIE alpha subunit